LKTFLYRILLDSILVFAKKLNMMLGGKARIREAKRIAKLLGVLSSEIRLIIVCTLIEKSMSVSELLEAIGTSMGNISQHLRILEENRILKSKKIGNKVFYSISSKKIISFIEAIEELCQRR